MGKYNQKQQHLHNLRVLIRGLTLVRSKTHGKPTKQKRLTRNTYQQIGYKPLYYPKGFSLV
jgi:hypothetical protein